MVLTPDGVQISLSTGDNSHLVRTITKKLTPGGVQISLSTGDISHLVRTRLTADRDI